MRLDEETESAIDRYAADREMTRSQATRVLLALALREADEGAEIAFQKASFREGVIAGMASFRKNLVGATQDAVESALGDMDEAMASRGKRR